MTTVMDIIISTTAKVMVFVITIEFTKIVKFPLRLLFFDTRICRKTRTYFRLNPINTNVFNSRENAIIVVYTCTVEQTIRDTLANIDD